MMMNIVRYFDFNIKGRDFVCGDLHGCLTELCAELDKVNFDNTRDRLFCTGDLIDKGTHSFECLSLLYQPWFFSVKANHHELLLACVSQFNLAAPILGNPRDIWFSHGGQWYIEHLKKFGEIKPDLLKKVYELPIVIVVDTPTGRANIVHAEFPYNFTDKIIDLKLKFFGKTDFTPMLWGTTRIRDYNNNRVPSLDSGLSTTYVGHSIVQKPKRIGQLYFIDTGAYKTGRLTLLPLLNIAPGSL